MASDRLNDFERGVLLPLVVGFLRDARGRKLTSYMIAEAIRKRGHACDSMRVRKIVNHIRCNAIIPCLAASGNGYFVASNADEITETINSLEGRVDAIQEVIEALKQQRFIKYNL